MGSEFRKIPIIERIFKHHPLWPKMKETLANGSHWPLEDLDSNKRAADVAEALDFGNHKGANENQALLHELIKKDVKYGYWLPPPSTKQNSSSDYFLRQ